MLEHIHHQHQVAVGRTGVAAIEHGLAGGLIVAVALVAGIDAQRPLGTALGQQVAREETRARPDIEQAPRPQTSDSAPQRGGLGAIVPVAADILAEDVLFLEVHRAQACAGGDAPSS
jgi:Flp pilus assembly pilin Flp